MALEMTTLRIKSERLGRVSEIREFLFDIEYAYNSLYTFDFIVESLNNERERFLHQLEERWYRMGKAVEYRKDFPFSFRLLREGYYLHREQYLINLYQLQASLDFNKIILPGDRLRIIKVNVQSPGFWEFLGALNPLQQAREYLTDRHEREKDKKYRSRQEEELGDLKIAQEKNNILTQRIKILKDLGYSDTEIRQLVMNLVIEPLNKLDKHQNNNLIEGPEE